MSSSDINPIFVFVWKKRIVNIAISFLLGILLIVYVFFIMEKKYSASLSLLPSAAGLSAPMGGGLGALANLAGLGSMGSGVQSQEMYAGIIHSRKLQSRLLDTGFEFEYQGQTMSGILLDFLEIEGESEREIYEKAFKAMEEEVLFTEIDNDNNILYLSVTLKNPVLAALAANKLVEYLDEIVRTQINKEYHEQYDYLKNRISVVGDSMKMAENALKEFLEKTRDFEAPQNIVREMRLRRAITVRTTIYAELKKQEEIFVLENMLNLSPVKVLDEARPPYRKSRPKRLLVLLSLFFFFTFIQFSINAGIVIYRRFRTRVISRIDE